MTPLDSLRGTPAWGGGEEPDPRCGTVAGYQAHSDRFEEHCQPCRTAMADWQRHYKTRRYLVGGGRLTVDACGVRRRVQALARMGWSFELLGDRLGVSAGAVRAWTLTPCVRLSTVSRVRVVYDDLWDQMGPSSRTRGSAERKGWPPPLAWDDDRIDDPGARPSFGHEASRLRKPVDDIAVARAMRGDAVTLTPQERTEAVRRLRAQGFSGSEIAARLGIAKRSVERIKAKAS